MSIRILPGAFSVFLFDIGGLIIIIIIIKCYTCIIYYNADKMLATAGNPW